MEKLLKTKEVAEILGVAKQTVEYWRWRGGGPVYIKFGRAVRYRMSDIKAFIEAGVKANTGG